MIKLLFFFLFFNVFAHHHIESTTKTSELGVRGSLRIFKFTKDINYLAEYRHGSVKGQSSYDVLELGGKYRLFRNLKIGLYYSRHFKGHDSGLEDENLIIGELSPRFLLDFLPGDKWVFEFRTRYEHSLNIGWHNLKIRPGLTYFWFKNGDPFLNIFFQHEVYRALNYAGEGNLAHWTYLGTLFHYNKYFKWSPFVSFVRESITADSDVNHDAYLLGLNLLFYL